MINAVVDVDLKIREAEVADAPALAVLMCELGYETTEAQMTTRLQRIVPDSRYKTFVALADNQVCGMIGTLCCPSYLHDDLNGRIIALVVASKMRRRGIGRELIGAAEKDFARKGITRVTLTTRLTRKEAHESYEELGYERNGFRFAKRLAPNTD